MIASTLLKNVSGTTRLIVRKREQKCASIASRGCYDCERLHLGQAAEPLSATRSSLFHGGSKTPYPLNRFDSDPERRLAHMMDGERWPGVLKWLRPGTGQFSIEWGGHRRYDPDLVVECTDCKLIVEVKATSELSDPEVQEKARAAAKWVAEANAFIADEGGKPWHYILLDERDVTEALTLSALRAKVQTVS